MLQYFDSQDEKRMRYIDHTNAEDFYAWQPSTWPIPPENYSDEFKNILQITFRDSVINEIENVINDAPTLEHRGHVVALSILCAIDTVSSYAFRNLEKEMCELCRRTDKVGPRYKKFIEVFFPDKYKPYANEIYSLYRNSITHSWNLFEAGMLPGEEEIEECNGSIQFGLKNFYKALYYSVSKFLESLSHDQELQQASLFRYKELKNIAKK
jgi:uncharacterized protein YqkB